MNTRHLMTMILSLAFIACAHGRDAASAETSASPIDVDGVADKRGKKIGPAHAHSGAPGRALPVQGAS